MPERFVIYHSSTLLSCYGAYVLKLDVYVLESWVLLSLWATIPDIYRPSRSGSIFWRKSPHLTLDSLSLSGFLQPRESKPYCMHAFHGYSLICPLLLVLFFSPSFRYCSKIAPMFGNSFINDLYESNSLLSLSNCFCA